VNFEGADHMVLGGHRMRRTPTELDRSVQSDVKSLTLAFWDAWLFDDAEAQAWLTDGRAARSLKTKAEYSSK
jgi:hypothetical protein